MRGRAGCVMWSLDLARAAACAIFSVGLVTRVGHSVRLEGVSFVRALNIRAATLRQRLDQNYAKNFQAVVSSGVYRQAKPEGTALVDGALHAYAPTVRLYDHLANGEPQPEALFATGALIKTFENVG